MLVRFQLHDDECQAKARFATHVLSECPVKAGTVSLLPQGNLEPGICQCHSSAQVAGRGVPSQRAELDPEPGPAPCRRRASGRGVWSQYQEALTFAAGSEPGSVSESACTSTPVRGVSTRSLSFLEAEPAYCPRLRTAAT
ncbi:hypothetical protein NDU88_004131 [Pleurodeles waltl]|uniref:Uncharacterized protein n=1 Tax=Pleurodeles waltl TaxID=8319 RepID=A0AAV7W855_PLEWA|nr:hypothetical protein NDU88_004131 [Pleurodeles waltl]